MFDRADSLPGTQNSYQNKALSIQLPSPPEAFSMSRAFAASLVERHYSGLLAPA